MLYGDALIEDMVEARGKVVGLALNGAQSKLSRLGVVSAVGIEPSTY